MTEQQILLKLTTLCARGEHCIHDMRQKMQRWQVDNDTQQRIISFLLNEKYIDEERYARAFINDKIRYNHWGKRKVEQALYLKGIDHTIYAPLMDEVEEEAYQEVLMPLLQSKLRSLIKTYDPEEGLPQELLDYPTRTKLLRYALQRGFTYEQAEHCINMM